MSDWQINNNASEHQPIPTKPPVPAPEPTPEGERLFPVRPVGGPQ